MRVLNSGTTVERVGFEVAGPCAAWTTVAPESLSLYPGASESATVTLRPPRDHTVAPGPVPLGVRVVPTSGLSETVVPEATVTVLPFTSLTGELVPRGSRGPRRGRHRIAVDGRGNTQVTVRLTAQEDGGRVRLSCAPEELNVPPGEATFARLRVRPAKRLWRGAPVLHPFQVVAVPVEAEGVPFHEPLLLDGTYEQQPLLPRWLPRALLAAAAAIALAVGLWFSVLRPTVRSAAREAVTPEVIAEAQEEMQEEQREREEAATQGSGGATGGAGQEDGGAAQGGASAGAATGGGGETGGAEGGTGGAQGAGSAATPTSARGEAADAVGGGATESTVYQVPEGQVFRLTDIVAQNPQGDAGSLVLSSQGATLFNLAMENFRDSDYHFVTPIVIPGGATISVSLDCREVGVPVGGPEPSACQEAVFLSGGLAPAEGAAG
ncbi:hypothetical protein D7294_10210 [Streptomyces hoynatensis]|uniref:Hydrolytic protein n=1 Tax=Streptomyces hoynatensis TaxID=1141874 RepID=A0A3A9Z7S3_9ACTN|nr:hypothetical protein D7294_10210 [Streptomyces hoynatensis]